jgi:hypothetical protein
MTFEDFLSNDQLLSTVLYKYIQQLFVFLRDFWEKSFYFFQFLGDLLIAHHGLADMFPHYSLETPFDCNDHVGSCGLVLNAKFDACILERGRIRSIHDGFQNPVAKDLPVHSHVIFPAFAFNVLQCLFQQS